MTLLTRDQILSADDLPDVYVEVPEWGGEVRIRTLTGAERDAYEARISGANTKDGKRDMSNIRAALVALCAIDENGAQLFTKDDVNRLGLKSAKALDRLMDASMKLSGISDDDVKKLADQEERAEDFDETQSEPSPSA